MQSRVKRVISVTGIIFILMLLLCVIMTNLFHYNYKMNSDIGAEAVLGRLIWDSKEIIPASWYPSTETRIIATPQVAVNITLRRSRLSGVARATLPDKQSHPVINYCIMF